MDRKIISMADINALMNSNTLGPYWERRDALLDHIPYFERYYCTLSREEGEDALRQISLNGHEPVMFIFLPRASVWFTAYVRYRLDKTSIKWGACHEVDVPVMPSFSLFPEEDVVHMYYCEPRKFVLENRPVRRASKMTGEGIRYAHAVHLEDLSIGLNQVLPHWNNVTLLYRHMVDAHPERSFLFSSINHEGRMDLTLAPGQPDDMYDMMGFLISDMRAAMPAGPILNGTGDIETVLAKKLEIFRATFPRFSLEFVPNFRGWTGPLN